MKKIFKEIILFVLPLVIIIVAIDVFSFTAIGNDVLGRVTFSTGYARSGSADVRIYINKVKEKSSATKLIVGDSVARQLFDRLQEENPSYCIAACNQALTLAGQYLLIDAFLESHDNVTDIYLCIVPMSLKSELNAQLGYNYVVAPFTVEGLINGLDEGTLEYIETKYGNIFLKEWMVRFIDNSPINSKIYLNYIRNKEREKEEFADDTIISDVNKMYLKKICSLCKEKGVELHFFSGPVPNNIEQKQFVYKLENMLQEKENLLLEEYIKTVTFYEESMFPDGTHLGGEYNTLEYICTIIADIQNKTGKLEDFCVY